jgi:hypothetical protein
MVRYRTLRSPACRTYPLGHCADSQLGIPISARAVQIRRNLSASDVSTRCGALIAKRTRFPAYGGVSSPRVRSTEASLGSQPERSTSL